MTHKGYDLDCRPLISSCIEMKATSETPDTVQRTYIVLHKYKKKKMCFIQHIFTCLQKTYKITLRLKQILLAYYLLK